MPDTSDISPNLSLPFYQTKQNEFEVQHNEALLILDALAMLSVIDRDLSAPPSSPTPGDRYLVKATGTGEFEDMEDRIAQYDTGGWNFYPPKAGWTCYVQDEQLLLVFDGDAWAPAFESGADITELQNLTLLGLGTTADSTNPLSAKLNNALWTAQTVAEGGSGDLRYVLSKESAANTLSLLFQDNFSGRAEIGLAGDDDFHFKTSADGSAWNDALTLDRTTGSAKVNAGFFLTGDISPSQITADQNDYNPAGLAAASALRVSSDASRNITGLSGGGDGRVIALLNVGSNDIVLKDASTSSSAGNRFDLGADLTIAAKKAVLLWYDATDARWKQWAGPGGGGGGSGTVTSVGVSVSGAGLTVGGSPVTSSGTITLTVDAELAALAGLTSAADKLPYFTGSGTAALADLTSTARSLLDDSSTSAMRTTLGLGNVDNTADSAKSVASAATLTTARNIDGQSFDGSAAITVIAPGTHAASGKTTPADADELPIVDSAASNVLKKLTWANLKAALKAYFDGLYGFIGIPQNSQSTAYTFVLSDNGKHILHPAADTTARNFTVPAYTTVDLPTDFACTIINQHGAGVITIVAPGGSEVMRFAGAGTTGNRTLAADGIATIKRLSTGSAGEWIISGVGLT